MNIIATKVQNQHRYFTFYLYVYLCQLCAYNVLNYDVKKVMIYFILCKLWNLNNKPKLNRLLIENTLSLFGFVPTFKFIVDCWYAIKSCHGKFNLILSNKVKFIYSEEATKFCEISNVVYKGQIISKCLCGVHDFFKKTSHTSKNELICLFFWKNSWLDNLLSKLTDL